MEDEFRIREKIIRDIESTSEDEYGESGADGDLYRGTGEGLDGVDSDTEKSIRYAEYALGTDENVGDVERPLEYAGGSSGGLYTPDYSYDYIKELATVCFGIKATDLIKAAMLDVEGFNADEIVRSTINQISIE